MAKYASRGDCAQNANAFGAEGETGKRENVLEEEAPAMSIGILV